MSPQPTKKKVNTEPREKLSPILSKNATPASNRNIMHHIAVTSRNWR